MSEKLIQVYEFAQLLLKNKDELLKYPDIFKTTLENLRKAVDDEEDVPEGMSIVDDPNESGEEDEADKWLKAQEAKKDEPQQKKYLSEWQPRTNYNDKESASIKKLMDQGYSHREASRMAGAHKEAADFRSAMKSGVAPSMMSDKMRADLKPLAKLWIEEADRQEKMKADPEANTVKRQAGQIAAAHDKHAADFRKEYNKFLASDKLKDLKGKDYHQEVAKWKSDWKKQNPQYEQGLTEVSNAQKQYAYDQSKAKQTAADRHQHIMSGGQSMPAEMSDQEALQHLGGGKTEEGYQGTITQDPSASFAARNPQLLAALKPEQQERKQRVDSAAKAQGVIRVRRGEGK